MEMNKYVNEVLAQIQQNTIAWDKFRLGKFTGSGISALMTQPRSKADKESGQWSQTALKYIYEKLMEEVTGQVCYESIGRAIDWGNEWEEVALMKVAEVLQSPPEKTQYKPPFKPFNDYSGVSADAIMYDSRIGSVVGVELKCPFNPVNHYLHSGVKCGDDLKEVNSDYYWQIQMSMLCHNIPIWVFASFEPRQPEQKVLHTTYIELNTTDAELLCDTMQRAYEFKEQLKKEWYGC